MLKFKLQLSERDQANKLAKAKYLQLKVNYGQMKCAYDEHDDSEILVVATIENPQRFRLEVSHCCCNQFRMQLFLKPLSKSAFDLQFHYDLQKMDENAQEKRAWFAETINEELNLVGRNANDPEVLLQIVPDPNTGYTTIVNKNQEGNLTSDQIRAFESSMNQRSRARFKAS